METSTIAIKPPSWETATWIYLEVLRTNDWHTDAGQSARAWLYELAKFMDYINENNLINPEDAKKMLDKIRGANMLDNPEDRV